MKGMDIEGVNKKLSRIVGESIDVGVPYDKSMKPTLIESIKKEIPDIWEKVQAIERSAERGEKVPLTENVSPKKNLNEWPSTDDKPLGTMGEASFRDEDDFITKMGEYESGDLIKHAQTSKDYDAFINGLPDEVNPECPIVRSFWRKYGKRGIGEAKAKKSADAFRNAREAIRFLDHGGIIIDPSDEETEMDRNEVIEYFSNEGGSWPEESMDEARGLDLLDKAKEYMQNGGAWAVSFRDVKEFLKENPKSSWKDLKAMMDEAQKEELMDADHMVDRFPGEDVDEAKLTYAKRKALPPSAFVFPKERKYPIHDIARGRNALARVSAFGTPAEKKAVRAAVYAKFPSLKEEEGKLVGKENESNESSGWANFNEAFSEYMKANS